MVQQEAVAQMKEEEQEEEVQKLQKVLLAQMLANDEVPEAGLSAKQEEPEQQVGAASPMSPTEEPEEPKQQVRFASPVSPPDTPVASHTSPADTMPPESPATLLPPLPELLLLRALTGDQGSASEQLLANPEEEHGPSWDPYFSYF